MNLKNFTSSIYKNNKSATLVIGLLLVLTLANFSWWRRGESCKILVDDFIAQGASGIRNMKLSTYVKDKCYEIILSTGDYKELYAYYNFYKYADEINAKYNKKNNIDKDLAPNDVYHWMLFYANQNSREFDQKTQTFKKEQGLYEQELKDFEEKMTQEEKIKSYSYIADNLAAGKEGWVLKNDYQKSFEYLKRAAEAGDVKSQDGLGASYLSGTDWMNKFQIEKNYIDGYKWIYLSTLHSVQRKYLYDQKVKDLQTLTQNFKMTQTQIHQAKQQAQIWLDQNKEFIKNHPLKIIPMTTQEIEAGKEATNKFIKDYGLDKPLPANQN